MRKAEKVGGIFLTTAIEKRGGFEMKRFSGIGPVISVSEPKIRKGTRRILASSAPVKQMHKCGTMTG
jgi:hypothetical protein